MILKMKNTKSVLILLSVFLFSSCEAEQKTYVNSTTNHMNSETEYPQGSTYVDTDGETQSQNGNGNEGYNKYFDDDETRVLQSQRDKCNGIDDDGDSITDEADAIIALKRPCVFPFRATSCIGMLDFKDIMFFESPEHPPEFGPEYCPGITKILTKTYLYSVSSDGLYQLPHDKNTSTIYFAKITSELTLKNLCERYDLGEIDFSKEFIVVLAYYFGGYSKYFDIGLVGGIKLSGDSILVDVFFYRDISFPVPLILKNMTWYGWDAFILPKKYLDFDIKFVSVLGTYKDLSAGKIGFNGVGFLKVFDYCPYSFEPLSSQNVRWRKVKVSDLFGCYDAADYLSPFSFPVFKVDVDYPKPVVLQDYPEFITTEILKCDGFDEDEYLIKPHAQFDYLKVIRKGGEIYVLVGPSDKGGGDYLPVVVSNKKAGSRLPEDLNYIRFIQIKTQEESEK